MSGPDVRIEGFELAQALERDQREQRQEDEAAIRREEELADRLATEMAKRAHGTTATD